MHRQTPRGCGGGEVVVNEQMVGRLEEDLHIIYLYTRNSMTALSIQNITLKSTLTTFLLTAYG